jgi:hypothetical protein
LRHLTEEDGAMTDPALRVQLEQLGDDLEALLAPLQAWLHAARPALDRYRATTVVLDEAPGNPAWLVERPEAARVMGLALGAARLLDEVALVDEAAEVHGSTGGWAYVEFLLGAAEAERLRAREVPARTSPQSPRLVEGPLEEPQQGAGAARRAQPPEPGPRPAPQTMPQSVPQQVPAAVEAGAAAGSAVEERLARLEADQRRLSTLVEAMSLALGAVGRTTADMLGRDGAESAAPPAVSADAPQVVPRSSHAA